VDAKYPPDETIKGTVTRTTDFGAFVELEPGVEGLIHISQLSDKRIDRVEHAVKEGQEVEAKVLDVDRKQRRISLSIKALIAPDSMPAQKASRSDMKKYVVSEKQSHGGESLGGLLNKFGDPNKSGLRGGLG
jgi:ribosomal protein S1